MHHDFPEPLCQKTSMGDKCIQIGTHGDGLSAETEEMAISPGTPILDARRLPGGLRYLLHTAGNTTPFG